MVYSGTINFLGIHVKNSEEVVEMLDLLLGARGADVALLILAQRKDCIFSKVPKGVIRMILAFKRIMEKELLQELAQDDTNDNYALVEKMDKEVARIGTMNLTLQHFRCCFFDGTFFVGFYLGHLSFIYRSELKEYDTFEEFRENQEKQWASVLETHAKQQDQIEKFKRIASKRFKGTQFEALPIKVYSFANDCNYCT